MVYQLCILPNCNIFRFRSATYLSPIHPDNVILAPVLLALHWLPVKFRIWYKISVISFKVFYNLGPTYLSNLINIKRCSRYNLQLRSNNVGSILQDPTAKFKCTLGDRSLLQLFKRYGTVYRTILGMILDKRLIIKTHYFKEAYSDLP